MTDATPIVRHMLRASLKAEGLHLHIVEPPKDALSEQQIAALGILATCAEAAQQLAEGASSLDRLAPYQRERMRHLGVVIKAAAADLEKGLNP